MNEFLRSILIFQIFTITSFAFKYEILLRDEQIFSPCDNSAFKFIDDYLDNSDIKFETLMNGSIVVKGNITFIRDLGKGNNPAMIETFKKQRDNWVSTIYNIERTDACKHIFEPDEIWTNVLATIEPPENRKCPFYKGQKLHFDLIADGSITLPDPTAAGAYKVEIKVELKDLNETFCTNMFMDVYRV